MSFCASAIALLIADFNTKVIRKITYKLLVIKSSNKLLN